MINDILNAIEEKVNYLFLVYQNQLKIKDGGVDVDEQFQLDSKISELATCITEILERQDEMNKELNENRELKQKAELVHRMEGFVCEYFHDVKWIDYCAYQKIGTPHIEEFIVLEWASGGRSYANNSCNSLSATARNVTRMLGGGVYENIEYYQEIMESEDWVRIV